MSGANNALDIHDQDPQLCPCKFSVPVRHFITQEFVSNILEQRQCSFVAAVPAT